MFGKKTTRINELTQQVRDLEGELAEIAPFAEDAKAISDHVSELLQRPGNNNYTASQIAGQAFKNIWDQRSEEARNQLASEYVTQHQDTLYQQTLDEIREKEGAQMDKDAQILVQTDAATIEAIRNKARAAAWQEALGRIAIAQKASVKEELLSEEERRMFFNEFNVRFKFDGAINLADKDLLSHLKHGDRLQIDLSAQRISKTATLEMVWRKESEKTQGWSPSRAEGSIFIAQSGVSGSPLTLPRRTITPIYTVGSNSNYPDIVKDDMPIGIKLSDRHFNIRVGDGEWHGDAVVTDCMVLPKVIELLDEDE